MPDLDSSIKGRAHSLERWGRSVLVVGLAGFGYLFLTRLGQFAESTTLLTVGGFMLASVIGALMILTGRRRGVAEVLVYGGRVCPWCRYPLADAGDMGVCPECGEPFTRKEMVAAWRARYPWLGL